MSNILIIYLLKHFIRPNMLAELIEPNQADCLRMINDS